jgi:predicted phage terminase large subunit-like protein
MAKSQKTKICVACGEALFLTHFSKGAKRCKPCIADGKKEVPQFRAAHKKHERWSAGKAKADKARNQKPNDEEWAEQVGTGVKKDKQPNRSRHLVEASAVRATDLKKSAITNPQIVKRELAGRKLAEQKLLYFIMRMFPAYQAGWVHNLICTKLEKFSQDVTAKKSPRLMLFLPPRSGKLIAHDVEVRYTGGFKRHGDLQMGDKVFDINGQLTEVTGVSGESAANWLVTLSDGTEVRCHGNHEWTVWSRGDKQWRTEETHWFTGKNNRGAVRALTSGVMGKRGGRYMYQLPLVEGPVEYPEQDITIDPYVLGVWLGDGKSTDPVICHDPRKQQHIDKMQERGLRVTNRYAHNNIKEYANVHYAYFGEGQLMPYLRSNDLYKNKHVPDEYLFNSVENRMELLAGLIDSDGTVDCKSRVMFSNTNKQLIDSFFELAQGLNFRPYRMAPVPPKLSSSGIQGKKTVYQIGFQPHVQVPTVVKPVKRLVKQRRLSIAKVERIPNGTKGKCIEVAAEDGLYLVTKNNIPTHNSEIASKMFPAWHLGHNPSHEIIAASYGVSLPMGFSRKIKDMMADPAYKTVFANTQLNKNAQATEGWLTTKGGGYVPAGCGSGITGKGSHILIVDDPIADAAAADSETQREAVWAWYGSTARTRISPGGGILCIQCMTGDTSVLMADNTERPLSDIRIGDEVATYEDGKLAAAVIRNWKSNGNDFCFKITTTSGKVVRANERHPFLVEDAGELKWVRVKNLRLGQRIVTLKDNGVSGKVNSVKKRGARDQLDVEGSASRITTSGNGLPATARRQRQQIQNRVLRPSSSTATGLTSAITSASSQSRTESALSVNCPQKWLAALSTGINCCALTTATTPVRLGGCSATTATLPLSAVTQSKCLSPLSNTSAFTLDTIVSVEAIGEHEVFDIQVDRTENFIAGGCVSHNTRWHDADLAGKLVQQQTEDTKEVDEELAEAKADGASEKEIAVIEAKYEEIEQWEVISLPALAEQDEYYDHRTGEITFRKENPECRKLREVGEALHPQRFNELAFKKLRRTLAKRHWSALYQQNPVPDDGDIFTKDSFRFIKTRPRLKGHHVYIAWDLAIGQKQRNDWTVGLVGALNEAGFLIIYDMVRVKTDRLAELICDTGELYKEQLQMMGLEQGQIQMSIMPGLNALFEKRKFYPVMTDKLKPVTDKVARARTAQGMAQHGKILLPEDQPWVETLLAELLRFPNSVHDDIADSLSWLCRMVEGQNAPRRAVKQKHKSWKDKLKLNTQHDGGAMSA